MIGASLRVTLASVALLLVGAIPQPAMPNQVTEVIEWSSAAGDVSFPHRFHAEDLEIACADCHHETNAGRLDMPHAEFFDDFWIRCESCHEETGTRTPSQACSVCHHDSPVTIADETLSSKVVIHRSCWTCHEVATGAQASESCRNCHQSATSSR
jgi:hypothetical protein